MIKNIPNKMSDLDLERYINGVEGCERSIDFLYLRMDFGNGCNVGYAFVNFIRVEELVRFVRERLGVKWCVGFFAFFDVSSIDGKSFFRNMYSSEKVLQMSYANYQYVSLSLSPSPHST